MNITELRELLEKATLPVQISCDDYGDPNLTGDYPEYELAVAAINALPALLEVAERAKACNYHAGDCPSGYSSSDECNCGIKELHESIAKLEAAK